MLVQLENLYFLNLLTYQSSAMNFDAKFREALNNNVENQYVKMIVVPNKKRIFELTNRKTVYNKYDREKDGHSPSTGIIEMLKQLISLIDE